MPIPTRSLATVLLAGLATGCSWRDPVAPLPPAPSGFPAHGRLAGEDEKAVQARLAWGRRTTLDAYSRIGLRDPRWDDAARTFIAESLPGLVGGVPAATTAQRERDGRALVARGCRDPLVLYLMARAVNESHYDSAEAEYYAAQAVDGMRRVPYPRAIARWAASVLHSDYQWRAEDCGLRRALAPLEAQWFRESLTDGSFQPGETAVLVYQLTTGTGIDFYQRSHAAIQGALEATPWIEPWARHMLAGRHYEMEGWRARGNGWASEVTSEGGRKFAALTRQAREELVEAWRLRRDRPEAAASMIAVSGDDPIPGEEALDWFYRAIDAVVDHPPAYDIIFGGLRPRWGGSYEQMMEVGRQAAATGLYQSYVPYQLQHAVSDVYDDQQDEKSGYNGPTIYEEPATYPQLLAMFSGYLKEPRSPLDPATIEGILAISADRAHRPLDALEHLKRAGGRLDRNSLGLLRGETASHFAARVVLDASPAASDARRGEALQKAFDNRGALAAYQAALAKDPSLRSSSLLQSWIKANETERLLEAGKWIPFLPTTAELHGWRPLLGTWTLDKDGALVGEAGARGLLIVSRARVGLRFEMRGRIELVSTSNGFFQAGMVFGGNPRWEDQRPWLSFRLVRNARQGSTAYFTQGFMRPDHPAPTLVVPDASDFIVPVEDGHATASVNDRLVEPSFVARQGWTKGDREVLLGFGGYLDENLFSVRFRNVEVRRLPD